MSLAGTLVNIYNLLKLLTAVVFTKSRVFNTCTIDLIFQIFFFYYLLQVQTKQFAALQLSIKWLKTKRSLFCPVSYTGLQGNKIEGVVLNKVSILRIFCPKQVYGKS